jgi:hypothetical protein
MNGVRLVWPSNWLDVYIREFRSVGDMGAWKNATAPVRGLVGRAHTGSTFNLITISGLGTVVGARFHPGGFTARYVRDAESLTGRLERADDLLPNAPHDGSLAALESAIATDAAPDETYRQLLALVEQIRRRRPTARGEYLTRTR